METTSEYLALWKAWGVETPLKDYPLPVRRSPAPAPAIAPGKFTSLEDVRNWIGDCRRCGLCEERKTIVFGSGNPRAKLMFVGEGPGADEDREGVPFVGKAGQLLTKIIEAMGHSRDEFYIANVVKCRPPQNRAPEPSEIEQCAPFLKAQIEMVQPKIIVALGLYAASALTGQSASMNGLRGRFHQLAWAPDIKVMPTYHPAYLLRNPSAKKLVWEDMKLVNSELEKHT